MSYRVHVRVVPRAGMLDPQGQAVAACARGARIRRRRRDVRIGRAIELEVAAASRRRSRVARAGDVRAAAGQSGHRRLRARAWRSAHETGGGRPVPRQQLRIDALRAAVAVGRRGRLRLASRHDLRGADVVILPGGFSYGDYLRSGAIARFSPIMQAVQRTRREAARCSGSATGSRSSARRDLLPGALLRNAGLSFVSRAGATCRGAHGHAVHLGATPAGDRAAHPGRPRRGSLRGDRRRRSTARRRRARRAPLRAARRRRRRAIRTAPRMTSPGSATPRATWSASCPTRSA